MAPKKSSESGGAAAAPGAGLGLTDNDLKLLDAIFKSAARTSKPNPLCSLEDIAQELGMKSGKVVTDRYRQIVGTIKSHIILLPV